MAVKKKPFSKVSRTEGKTGKTLDKLGIESIKKKQFPKVSRTEGKTGKTLDQLGLERKSIFSKGTRTTYKGKTLDELGIESTKKKKLYSNLSQNASDRTRTASRAAGIAKRVTKKSK